MNTNVKTSCLAALAALVLLAYTSPVCRAQINDNAPITPRWAGLEPVHFCIDPSVEVYRPEILSALWVWQRETDQIVMAETQNCLALRTITVRLSQEGTTMPKLAVTMYPTPMYQEPEAGDVWLNRDVDWNVPANRRLLFALLIHEFGHALGMVHYYEAESVMFPNIDPAKTALFILERKMFRCLYGTECGWHN